MSLEQDDRLSDEDRRHYESDQYKKQYGDHKPCPKSYLRLQRNDRSYAQSKSGARAMSSTAQSYEQSGEKRKLMSEGEEKAILTPRTIRKAAKISAENSPQLLAWIKEYPKN